jgi:hypothetical protein
MASLLHAESDIEALNGRVNNLYTELSDTLKQLEDANEAV